MYLSISSLSALGVDYSKLHRARLSSPSHLASFSGRNSTGGVARFSDVFSAFSEAASAVQTCPCSYLATGSARCTKRGRAAVVHFSEHCRLSLQRRYAEESRYAVCTMKVSFRHILFFLLILIIDIMHLVVVNIALSIHSIFKKMQFSSLLCNCASSLSRVFAAVRFIVQTDSRLCNIMTGIYQSYFHSVHVETNPKGKDAERDFESLCGRIYNMTTTFQ